MKSKLKYFLVCILIGILLETTNYFIPIIFMIIMSIATLFYLFLLLSKKIWKIIKDKNGNDNLMILIKPIALTIISGLITKSIITFFSKK